MNEPREFDAVLGGNNPPPKDGVVLGGELRWTRSNRTIRLPETDTEIQTPLFDNEAIAILENIDNDFAKSLVINYKKRNTLSEKQWFYVHKLVLDNRRQEETSQLSNAGLSQIYTYVSSFKNKKLEIVNEDGNGIKFYKGITSKSRNKIQVVTTKKSVQSNVWCGRIERVDDKNFVNTPNIKVDLVRVPSRLKPDWSQHFLEDEMTCKFFISHKMPDWAYELLKKFVESPSEVAKVSSQVTGCCCFCGLTLTDKRSLLSGYGPICATKYGLPWGEVEDDSV